MEKNKIKLEKGSASILVTLSKGNLIITHGTNGSLLLDTPIAEGSWSDKIWKFFEDLKKENE